MSAQESVAPTIAQRLILDTLTEVPQTPAQIKRRRPGSVPVATVRRLLGELQALGLARTATSASSPGVTAWVKA